MSDGLSTLTKQVLFSPLDDSGRTETVVGRIRSAIMLGIFADGEQLPNEIDLAGQLQVSPVTLRDALKAIREEGLARTTRGRSGGTFVIAPDESNMGRFEERLAAMPTLELRDLLDWQSALNGHSSYLAASRGSQHEAEVLANTMQQFRAAADAPHARRIMSRFLIEISSSSRSARLSKEIITLQIEVAPHAMLVFRDVDVREQAYERGMAVVFAIKAQRPALANERCLDFLDYINDRIIEFRHELTYRSPQPTTLQRKGVPHAVQ